MRVKLHVSKLLDFYGRVANYLFSHAGLSLVSQILLPFISFCITSSRQCCTTLGVQWKFLITLMIRLPFVSWVYNRSIFIYSVGVVEYSVPCIAMQKDICAHLTTRQREKLSYHKAILWLQVPNYRSFSILKLLFVILVLYDTNYSFFCIFFHYKIFTTIRNWVFGKERSFFINKSMMMVL